jgi:hypothetical protein
MFFSSARVGPRSRRGFPKNIDEVKDCAGAPVIVRFARASGGWTCRRLSSAARCYR